VSDLERVLELSEIPTGLFKRYDAIRFIREERSQYAPFEIELVRLRNAVMATTIQVIKLQNQVRELTETLAAKGNTVSFILTDLASDHYQTTSPLAAYLEIGEDENLAHLIDVDVFGTGDTPTEALQDLKSQIISLYEELQESKPEELGPAPERWKKYFTDHIKKIGSP
jgi:hypothetical protein